MAFDLNEHLKKKQQNGQGDRPNPQTPKRDSVGGSKIPQDFGGKKFLLMIGVVVMIAIVILARPFVVIQSGEVGIKVTAGKYDPNPLRPGIHFFVPILQNVIVVDTRVRIINFSRTEDMGVAGKNQGIFRNDAISVMDSRGLSVSIELTVQYQLNANATPKTIETYGLSWEQKIINPVVRDVVRSVVGRYPAEELPIKRNEIAQMISANIQEEISKLPDSPVTLKSVQLREIVLPTNIREQIEKVQIARQESERVRYEVLRAKQEAEKVAALAKGEADANRVKAQGIADAILIEANAQSKANKAIADSLTRPLLELRQIETQNKFNEALKVNKDAQIFLTPGGAVPNIWVDSKSRKQSTSVGK
ncbi:hypothetical protein BBW65_07545 [Helicobacter enhydrae]|uniref:Band 7 domain-containing protein n=1 Tax=Helicobacter enhydrae TaxID=222136 RepID=A0A1B1U7B0_9HELI|nr:prohibitin family protein [Helicobacter enhydrae]ANV98659.1 hypothetical protein BBW65_07545 [Helicobacter enhydrae]